jgi:dTDP-4-dehydrorhamnose 3,5-epimerase-like enzyme
MHLLDGSVRVLDLETFRDVRGVLTPIDFSGVGFAAARAFVVAAPQGAVRGGHAHLRVRQILLRASGVIEVELRRAGSVDRVILNEDRPAILLEAGVWARQTYLAPASTLVVFADGPYDPAEYSDSDIAMSDPDTAS